MYEKASEVISTRGVVTKVAHFLQPPYFERRLHFPKQLVTKVMVRRLLLIAVKVSQALLLNKEVP